MMSTIKWPRDELKKISVADDLKVSPFREDGKTYGTPTWIWNVAVKGDLLFVLIMERNHVVPGSIKAEIRTHSCCRNGQKCCL